MADQRIWELHRTAFAALMGGIVAAVFSVLFVAGAMRPVENVAYDQRFRWLARPELASKDVVLISLDNASFAQPDMLKYFGRWPWDRKLYGILLWYLRQAPARTIGIDILFAGRDEHAGSDQQFINELAKKRDTVLAFSLTDVVGTAPEEAELAELRRHRWHVARPECGPKGGHPGLDLGLRDLNQHARALGCIRGEPDSDGILRGAPLVWRYAGDYYPILALALTAPATAAAEFRCSSMLKSATVRIGDREFPVHERSREALLYWYGKESVVRSDPAAAQGDSPFRNFPVWAIVDSAVALNQGEKPAIDPAVFRDKIVLIGPQAAGIGDIRPTPLSATMPGAEVQATLISNLLQGHFVTEVGRLWGVLAIVLLSLGTSLAVWSFPDWRGYTAVTVGLGMLFVAVNFALLYAAMIAVPLATPLIAVASSYATGNVVRYITEGREKKRYRSTLMKYVAPQLVEAIMKNPKMADLHNEKLDLTVLFSDVRGFTSISEKIPVDQLVATLNEFLNAMVEAIFRNGGTLDKFVGDCVMAIWGAPVHQANHAEMAARTAIEMQAELKRLNDKWRGEGRPELAIGVGINTGEMIFGNIGAQRRMDFTVIGDNVNLASRLESATKELKASIVISDATYQRIKDVAEVRDLGLIHVKGKATGIKVYELLGMSHDKAIRALHSAPGMVSTTAATKS